MRQRGEMKSHPTRRQPAAGRARGGRPLSPVRPRRAKPGLQAMLCLYSRRGIDPGKPRLPPAIATDAGDADSALRRELHFYTLYRLLEAMMLVLVLFGPVADMLGPPRHELLAPT